MVLACSPRVLVCYFPPIETQYGTVVGTYLTKPGTALGTPERVNVVYPLTKIIAIGCSDLTAVGTVSISEVRTITRRLCVYFCPARLTPNVSRFFLCRKCVGILATGLPDVGADKLVNLCRFCFPI